MPKNMFAKELQWKFGVGLVGDHMPKNCFNGAKLSNDAHLASETCLNGNVGPSVNSKLFPH